MDGAGDPFPTYDQAVDRGLRPRVHRVALLRSTLFAIGEAHATATQILPMKAYPAQHATGSKKLLELPWRRAAGPAGWSDRAAGPRGGARQYLQSPECRAVHFPAADPAARHEQPVARLTSRASPRCSTTTDRGSVATSARSSRRSCSIRRRGRPPAAMTDVTGKLKEPLLRLLQFWRAYDAAARNGNYRLA